MKILVLGATGMLGYEVSRICLKRGLHVDVIVRNKELLVSKLGNQVNLGVHILDDIKNFEGLTSLIQKIKPTYIVNCIGVVKQSVLADDGYESVSINSLLPHQLVKIGQSIGSRLIHVSTDCVFDGKKGSYKESDLPNATDLYGKSKHLGEVSYSGAVTLRTSIIGHEIGRPTHGLVEWFLSQNEKVDGFKNVFFSGLTTLELSNVILDEVIAKNLQAGLYQVSSGRISKFDLISLIAEIYGKSITIFPNTEMVLDRSLDGTYFKELTNYIVPSWRELVQDMKNDFESGF